MKKFRRSPAHVGALRSSILAPRMDVKETDKEIIIEAELPGEGKDILLTLQNGVHPWRPVTGWRTEVAKDLPQ